MITYMLKLRKLLLLNKTFYIILFLTVILTIIRFNIKPKSILNTNVKIVSGVITKLNYDSDKISLTLKISSNENLKATYYLRNNKYIKLRLGESVKLIGSVKKVNNSTVLNGFNYKEYLRIEKVNYLFSIRKIIKLNKRIPVIYLIKNKVLDYINSFHNSSYIKMLLLGDTNGVDIKVINSFRENGISHLFAISGTQVTVLAEVILKLLLMLKIKEKKRYIITNSFIIIYMLLTGSPPAILRAVIFFFLSSINKYNYFYITNMNLFILTLAITLIINPYYIYDLGFLYSYLISFGLILFCVCFNVKTPLIAVGFCTISFGASLSPLLVPLLHDYNGSKVANTAVSVMTCGFYIVVALLGSVVGFCLDYFSHLRIESSYIAHNSAYIAIFSVLFLLAIVSFVSVFRIEESKKTLRLIEHIQYIKEREASEEEHWHDEYEHDLYTNI